MAMRQEERATGWGLLQGPRLLVGYLAGLVLLYVGERIVGGSGATRLACSGLGVLLLLAATLGWVVAWRRQQGEQAQAERLAAGLALLGLGGLVVYLLGSELLLGPPPLTQPAGLGWRQVTAVAWPLVLAVAVLALVFLQVSAASMGRGRGTEIARLRASARAGATTAMLLGTLFFANAIANRLDASVDLSYFKTTSPGEASRSLVTGLDRDTEALLFFPPNNEVLVEIEPYFKELQKLSERFTYRVVDRALEPKLARKWRISSDGTILLVRGEATEKIVLGDNLDRAKRTLRKFDKEFLKNMIKLNRRREVVYFLSGHGERSGDYNPTEVRSRVSVLKRFLQALNMTVKNLGPTEGLATAVPQDAGLLVWIDPAGRLFPGEAHSLIEYLERGGRLLLALDTEYQGAADEVLEHLGLVYHPQKLANQKAYIVLDNAPSDIYNLVTNSYSSHPAVNTLARASRYFPLLLPGSGYLERARAAGTKNKKKRLVFTVRSMPQTWVDANENQRRDADEAGRVYQLAAAVSWKVDAAPAAPDHKEGQTTNGESAAKKAPRVEGAGQGDKKEGGKSSPAEHKQAGADTRGGSKVEQAAGKNETVGTKQAKRPQAKKPPAEARVVVLADADLLADRYIGFRLGYSEVGGNLQLLADSLRWLLDEQRVPGVGESEEDVKIVHTRDEDKVWFYGMVFGVPLLILGFGTVTRWGRGRKRRVA